MSRRITKAESKALGALLIVGLPIAGIVKFFEAVGWVIPIALMAAGISLFIWYQHDKKQKRLLYLRAKYQDEALVQKIFQGYFWQGQNEDQLQDALGPPAAVDHKVLKTKTRDIWKYQHQGANRFGLRITVEDGYVTGWDKRA